MKTIQLTTYQIRLKIVGCKIKELLQLIGKILPNGTINSFSSFLSQNWHKYVQQGITKWKEILNELYGAVNFIPGILLQKKNQVLNKLKKIQGLSGTMLKSAFDKMKAKISKVLDDLASKINPQKKAATNVDNATKKASQLPMALTTAKAITEANDAINTPVPALIGLLNASVKSKYTWINKFVARPKTVPGHYTIHMIASDHIIDNDYTTGKGKQREPITDPRIIKELPLGQVGTPEELEKARQYFKNRKLEARRRWEERTGEKWPIDKATGQPARASHPRPLADGGDPMVVEQKFGDPNTEHMIPNPVTGKTDQQRFCSKRRN